MKIAVVGGGIAGLAAAYRLAPHHDVTVFERESVPGGKIRSERDDGLLFDWGPNGFLSNATALREIVGDLGLDDELSEAGAAAAKRYIYWNGRLHALPQKPPQALATALLSPFGKLRALSELRARPPAQTPERESVAAFFTRHFGREVTERIVAPALLGISGGDAAENSVDALFPRLRELEREHGSVLRGVTRSRGPRAKLVGFGAAGMARVPLALAAALGDRLRCGVAVTSLDRIDGAWRIGTDAGEERAEAIVLAVPSFVAAELLRDTDTELADALARIAYAPMRVAALAYRAADVPVPLDGFGFLAARGQGVRILGALFTSTMYPAQAPPDTAFLRIFMGGAKDIAAVGLDETTARAAIRADLETTLRITAEPLAYRDFVWTRAIPQYSLDHPALVREIERRSAAHDGLALTGNAYRGIGVGDAVKDAVATAQRFLR